MSVKGFYINGEIQHYDYESLDNKPSDGLTEAAKSALLQLARKVAYIDEHGEDYYQSLYESFYGNFVNVVSFLSGCSSSNTSTTTKEGAAYTTTIYADSGYTLTGATVSITMGGLNVTGYYSNGTINIPNVTGNLVITVTATSAVSSISAVYTQSEVVCNIDSLDSLKADLVVTAHYSDSSTQTVPAADYTLSGTLTAGTSTITVSYGGKTTTFTATIRQANRMLSGITWKGFGTNASASGNVDVSFNVSSNTTNYANGALTNGPDSASYKFSQLAGHRIRVYIKNSVWNNYVDGTYLLLGPYFGTSSLQQGTTRHAGATLSIYPDTEDGFWDSVVPATLNDFPSGGWRVLDGVDPSAMTVDDYFGFRMYFMGDSGLKKASFSFEIYDLGAES